LAFGPRAGGLDAQDRLPRRACVPNVIRFFAIIGGIMQGRIFRGVAAALAACWLAFASTALYAQSDGRMDKMLKDTGFSYTTHNPTTWSMEFERKTLGKVRVIVSTGSDIVVVFAIIAKKANINKTPKMMEALLRANHDYDYVKIGLDNDGDLFVRIDDPLRITDARELKDAINQVANASEEVFVKVAGSIKR
jgi:hypothetical protein